MAVPEGLSINSIQSIDIIGRTLTMNHDVTTQSANSSLESTKISNKN